MPRPEPTLACRRYGCHENPRTGLCNRCAAELSTPEERKADQEARAEQAAMGWEDFS